MTPKAKYEHAPCNVGRMDGLNNKEKRMHYLSCRKYVMVKLFGYKGLLIFGWQNFGATLIKLLFKVLRKNYTNISISLNLDNYCSPQIYSIKLFQTS